MTRWSTPALAAVSHSRRGWVLVPLRPGTGLPARKWKHLTTTPPGAVAACWPGSMYNPGILPGPSNLVGFDLDDLDGHGGTLPPEWADSGVTHGSGVLAVLAERAGQTVPATYEVTTYRDGRHLYFRNPHDRVIRNSAGLVGPLVDVRGAGGLIVGAGSIRNGRTYEVVDDRDPVVLPDWLADLATKREPPPRAIPRADVTVTRHGYGAAALRAEVGILLAARCGRRNAQLNKSAFSLGTLIGAGYLSAGEVTSALLAAAAAIGLADDDGQAQCERTIASGLTAGIVQPRIRGAA